MSDPRALPEQFWPDVEALLNGTLDDEGMRRLEAALLDDSDAQQQFLDHCALHTDLTLSASSDRAIESLLSQPQSVSTDGASSKPTPAGFHRWFLRPTALSLTVAAVVIGLLITAMAFVGAPIYRQWAGPTNDANENNGPVFVAALSGTHEAVWEKYQVGTRQGAQLIQSHRMRLESGLAEVTFKSGATVTLQGPATFELKSKSSGRLISGSLVANVPRKAQGFTVATQAARIVDLGTQFGVEVTDDGAAQVVVLDGEVECATAAKTVRLTQGQGAFISADGTSLVKRSSADSRKIAAYRQRLSAISNMRSRLHINIDDSAGPLAARLPPGYQTYLADDRNSRTMLFASPLAKDERVGVNVASPYFRNTNDSSYGDVTVLDRSGDPLSGYNAVMNSGALINESNQGPIRITLSQLKAGQYRIKFYLHGIFPRRFQSAAQGRWNISGSASAHDVLATFGFNTPKGGTQGVPPTDLRSVGQIDLAFTVSAEDQSATFEFTPSELAANGQLWVNGFELMPVALPSDVRPKDKEDGSQP